MSKDYIHSAVSFVAQANTVFIIRHSTDKYCTNTRKIHLKTITPKTRMKIRNQSQTNFSLAKNWFWFGFFSGISHPKALFCLGKEDVMEVNMCAFGH